MSQSSQIASQVVGLGSAIGVAISWSVNQSIWWCIGHGLCSWWYVIFYAAGWTDR